MAILNRNPIFRYLQIQSILPIRWSPFSSPDAVDSTGGAGDNMVDCQLFPKNILAIILLVILSFKRSFTDTVALSPCKTWSRTGMHCLDGWDSNSIHIFKVNSFSFLLSAILVVNSTQVGQSGWLCELDQCHSEQQSKDKSCSCEGN